MKNKRNQVLKVIKITERERGKRNEEATEKALIELKNENKIIDFYKSSSYYDKKGIDFFIIYLKDDQYCKVGIQVKSSYIGLLKHKSKFSEIPCIIVNYWDNIENIKNKILELIYIE